MASDRVGEGWREVLAGTGDESIKSSGSLDLPHAVSKMIRSKSQKDRNKLIKISFFQ